MSATRAGTVHQPWPGLIAAYRDRLPVEDNWTPITLLEGGTPLIHAAAAVRTHRLHSASEGRGRSTRPAPSRTAA